MNLFTRLRRFGKTLNLSMIRYFFEDAGDAENEARRRLFDGLKIMEAGDAIGMQQVINEQLMGMISFMDSAENFYHGFMTGVLGQNAAYRVKSNRESGNGRGDLFVYPVNLEKKAFVMELKASDTFGETDRDAREAVRQITEKSCAEELFQNGVAFYRKNCKVCCGGTVRRKQEILA